jgi:AraC-like DNA-binding protein
VRVGYESASQFSREYRRLFGGPPPGCHTDAARLCRRSPMMGSGLVGEPSEKAYHITW